MSTLNRKDNKSIQDHQLEFHKRYLDRESSMDAVFRQTVRIVQELQSRMEREMFRGMQYKADQDPTVSLFDKDLTKSAESMGKLVAQLQTTHLRLVKEGEKQAKAMSREDKMEFFIKFVSRLPPGDKMSLRKELGWDE